MNTCQIHICVVKNMFCCLVALKFVQSESPDVFEVSHLNDRTLDTSSDSDMSMVILAAKRYKTNPNKLKSSFPVHAF